MNRIILTLLMLFTIRGYSQTTVANRPIGKKGKLFFYWGWNRENFTKSDIHFKGSNYDFTLKKTIAKDRPSKFDPLVYFNPLTISIPQYQYRFGYYINNKYSISGGFNHMKYVVQENQTLKIDGVINTPEAAEYNGTYKNQDFVLKDEFLHFEHTNGLNYISLGLDRTDTYWESENKKYRFNIIQGINFGILFPKSDVRLFGERYDKWHLSGYGTAVHVAPRFDFLSNFFIQLQLESGYINMPDIVTTNRPGARAQQSFFYLEEMISFGGYYSLWN